METDERGESGWEAELENLYGSGGKGMFRDSRCILEFLDSRYGEI